MKKTKLLKFIGMSVLKASVLLIGVSIVSFLLVTSSPIDPVDAYIGADNVVSEEQRQNIVEYWGLDKGSLERYVIWAKNLLHGDMGDSLVYRKPVVKVIGERVTASLSLMITAWMLSGIIGFVMGIVAAAKEGKIADHVIKKFCLLLSSTPTFWFGLLMLVLFAIKLKWFPTGLAAPVGERIEDVTLGQRIYHLVLPAITLSVSGISNIALHTRQKLIDVKKNEFFLFAQTRGERGWTNIWRHGLRNIALPAITLQFASFSELFGGSVLAEQVFSYPGLGNAATTAGLKGDVPLLLGIALCSALFVFIGNLIANILYGILDPRIREEATHEIEI